MKFESTKELYAASSALRDWLESQSIIPADAVLLMEFFIARMIVENGKNSRDVEDKFTLINDSIRTFTSIIVKVN